MDSHRALLDSLFDGVDTSQRRRGFDPESRVKQTKFDTALSMDTVQHFKNKLDVNPDLLEVRIMLHDGITIDRLRTANSDPDCWATCLKNILTGFIKKIPKHYHDNIVKAAKASYRATLVSLEFNGQTMMKSKRWSSKLQRIATCIDKDEILQKIRLANEEAKDFANVMNKYGERDYQRSSHTTMQEHLMKKNVFKSQFMGFNRVVFNGTVCFIETAQNSYLLPYTYLSMIHNKISEMVAIGNLSHFMCKQTLVEDFPSCVYRFILMMCDLMIIEKERFFEVARSLEGILIGKMIQKHEKWENSSYWNTVLANLNSAIVYRPQLSMMINFLISLPDPAVSELVSLSKIAGHPIISSRDAIQKLTTKAFNDNESGIDLKDTMAVTDIIVIDYIDNHLDCYKTWPKVQFLSGAPAALRIARANCWKLTSRSFKKEYGLDPFSLAKYIKLEPGEILSSPQTILEQLKDRAVSVCQSSILKNYLWSFDEKFENDVKGLQEEAKKKRREQHRFETRLLLYYLLTQNADIPFTKMMEFITHKKFHKDFINKDGKIVQPDWLTPALEYQTPDQHWGRLLGELTIKLTIKEKELKQCGRLFGSLTPTVRAVNQVLENNMANWITKHTTYQTLKLSESDLLKKLHSFTMQKHLFSDYIFFMISFDASSWCQVWRDITCRLNMKPFDDVFGVKCYTERMKMYENSILWMESPCGTYLWNGQSGGIEGLSQYTWTFLYNHQATYAIRDFADFSRMLIKGDDLRMALLVHRKQLGDKTPAEYAQHIMSKFSENMAKFGHKIKVEESYCSSRILVFSRCLRVDDVIMPNLLRKGSKISGIQDTVIDTLEEKVASCFSNAHSSGPHGYCPIGLYHTACLMSATYMAQDQQFKNLNEVELTTALLLPSVLGGLPVLMLHNFFVRQESDHLSSAIELYKYLCLNHRDLAGIFTNFIQTEPRELTAQTYKNLLSDPYAVNTTIPVGALTALRLSISEILPRVSNNEQILELYRLKTLIDDNEFVNSLLTGTIWHAKVYSLLYMVLPTGLITNLLRQFESCKSLFEATKAFCGYKYAKRVLRKAFQCDYNRNKWRIQRYQAKEYTVRYQFMLPEASVHICSTLLADKLREASWGKRIVSITHPAQQHFLTLIPDSLRQPGDRSCSFEVIKHTNQKPLYDDIETDLYNSRTDSTPPFFGSTTSKKLEQRNPLSGLDVPGSLQAVFLSLIELEAFTAAISSIFAEQSPVRHLITLLFDLYIDDGARIIEPYTAQLTSGCIDHRLSGPKYKRSVQNNVTPNIYNRYNFNSNSHSHLRGTSQNYNINVLGCFSSGVSFYHLDLQFSRKLEHDENFLIRTISPEDCPYCWSPIPELPIDFQLSQKLIHGILYCTRTSMLKSIYLVQDAIQKFQSNYHELMLTSHGSNVSKQNINILERSQLESICSRAIVDYYLGMITHTQELAASLTNHRIGAQALAILDPLVNPSPTRKFILVRHWRRIKHSEYLGSMITMVLNNCFFHIGSNDPFRWLTHDLLCVGPNYSPWLLFLRDIQEARMLHSFLNYLATLTDFSLSYQILTQDREMAAFINNCLSYLIRSNYEILNEIYFISNESPAKMRDKILLKQAVKLWLFLQNHGLHRHDDDFIALHILPHIMPIKSAKELSEMLAVPSDSFEYYVINWPCHKNELVWTDDDETDEVNFIERMQELLPAITNAKRFAFLRRYMNLTCPYVYTDRCTCIEQLLERECGKYLSAIIEHPIYFPPQRILHLDAAVCLDIIASRDEQFKEFEESTIHNFGGIFKFRTRVLRGFLRDQIIDSTSFDWMKLTCYSGSMISKTEIDPSTVDPLQRFEETNINLSHYMRTHGDTVPAATRIMDLCNYWMIQPIAASVDQQTNVRSTALFLGDGIGSTSYAFLKHYTQTNVIWNTKVNHDCPIVPIATNDPETAGRVMTRVTRNLLEDDLSEFQTVQALAHDYKSLVNLVFCDASITKDSVETVYKIYCNVILISILCKPVLTPGLCFIRSSLDLVFPLLHALTRYQNHIYMIEFVRPRGTSHLNDFFTVIHFTHTIDYLNDMPTFTSTTFINRDIYLTLARYWRNLDIVVKSMINPVTFINTVKIVNQQSKPYWKEVPTSLNYISSVLMLHIDQLRGKTSVEVCNTVRSSLLEYVKTSVESKTVANFAGVYDDPIIRPPLVRMIPLVCIPMGFLYMASLFNTSFVYDEAIRIINGILPRNLTRLFRVQHTVNHWFPNIPVHYSYKAIICFNKGLFLYQIFAGIKSVPNQIQNVEDDYDPSAIFPE
uniref:RNA-directed RNA polymerase n=1 Tax=Dermatophagoides pteronyssinus virus 7 TaxID=2851134 RepID=A0A8F3E7D1_9VIRU|nr:hypothetical protein DerpV7_gp1 [Dermatophagoides pteronyssinus virus 7]